MGKNAPNYYVLIYLVCHLSWAVRKIAYDATKKILSSSRTLAEDLLFLFTDWLSLVGARISILKQSDMDSSGDSQLPFIPSTEVLVKCLFLIAPYAIDHSRRSYSQLILCSHHPCISSSSSPAGVWKIFNMLTCPFYFTTARPLIRKAPQFIVWSCSWTSSPHSTWCGWCQTTQ